MEFFSIELSSELMAQVYVPRDYKPLTKKEQKQQKKIQKKKEELEKLLGEQ